MPLTEFIKKFHGLNIEEERKVTDNFIEIVIYTKEIEEWIKQLSEHLGDAAKPKGVKPTGYDKKITQEYGGINKDQILFKKEFDVGVVIIAMLWPWQDGEHVTCKMVYLTN